MHCLAFDTHQIIVYIKYKRRAKQVKYGTAAQHAATRTSADVCVCVCRLYIAWLLCLRGSGGWACFCERRDAILWLFCAAARVCAYARLAVWLAVKSGWAGCACGVCVASSVAWLGQKESDDEKRRRAKRRKVLGEKRQYKHKSQISGRPVACVALYHMHTTPQPRTPCVALLLVRERHDTPLHFVALLSYINVLCAYSVACLLGFSAAPESPCSSQILWAYKVFLGLRNSENLALDLAAGAQVAGLAWRYIGKHQKYA